MQLSIIILLSNFKRTSLWNLFLLSSFIPWLCWLIDHALQEPTMQEQTKDNPFSCVRCKLQSLLQDDQRPQNVPASQLQPVQCSYLTSIINAALLKTHMLVHSGEKPYVCARCNFSCTTTGHLKTHMLTHSGEKPFSCKQWTFSCATNGNLKTHWLTHSGEEPFSCTQCEYSGTSQQLLTSNDISSYI